MANNPKTPQWLTADRKAKLLELWAETNNRCLLGHRTCPIPEHYLYGKSKTTYISEPVDLPATDRGGEPIRDSDGNPLHLRLYKPVKVTEDIPVFLRLFDLQASLLIAKWQAEDRAIWQAERQALHRTAERTEPLHGRFSAVSRDIWHDRQPLFYIEGYGMDGLRLQPFAKVRISGGYVTLFVSLGDSLRQVSKNRKRKAIRYGKALPPNIEETIRKQVANAVIDYLNH